MSRASIVSNGSIHNGPDAGPEEISHALGAAYRRYWTIPETDALETFRAAYREIATLETRISPDVAWWTLREAATAYHQETGICPFCGEHGELHLRRAA